MGRGTKQCQANASSDVPIPAILEPWAGQAGTGRAQPPWNHLDTAQLQTGLPKTNPAGRTERLCPAGKEVTLLLRKEQFKNIQLLLIDCLRFDVNVWRKLFPFREVRDYLVEGNSKQDRNISLFYFLFETQTFGLAFQAPNEII